MRAFEDYIAASRAVSSPQELKALFGRAMGEEGYENHVMVTVGEHKLLRVAWHELPEHFPETYRSSCWERIDPLLPLSLRARRAFLWDDVARFVGLDPEQQRFFDMCRELKVHSGFVVPIHGPGNVCEMISISKRHDNATDETRLPLVSAICTQTWMRYLELTTSSPFADRASDLGLTRRELEVLKWIKDGKSNTDIADILSISVRTVEHHVSNVLTKLGAANRITAVVIALQLGLVLG